MKALVKVGYGCNENCTFCHTADVRHLNDTADRVDWKIERAKRLGYDMVVLSGGEPTVRPELRRWAAKVASLGLDVKKVAVERNLEIVPKSTFPTTQISDGDRLEIVHFIGGG